MGCFQESGDDEYHGEHSDTEDEVDSDFDIDEGDEPDSDQEEDAPRRKSRVVTKAYKVLQAFSGLIQSYYTLKPCVDLLQTCNIKKEAVCFFL